MKFKSYPRKSDSFKKVAVSVPIIHIILLQEIPYFFQCQLNQADRVSTPHFVS